MARTHTPASLGPEGGGWSVSHRCDADTPPTIRHRRNRTEFTCPAPCHPLAGRSSDPRCCPASDRTSWRCSRARTARTSPRPRAVVANVDHYFRNQIAEKNEAGGKRVVCLGPDCGGRGPEDGKELDAADHGHGRSLVRYSRMTVCALSSAHARAQSATHWPRQRWALLDLSASFFLPSLPRTKAWVLASGRHSNKAQTSLGEPRCPVRRWCSR